jgi:hypothetical protein
LDTMLAPEAAPAVAILVAVDPEPANGGLQASAHKPAVRAPASAALPPASTEVLPAAPPLPTPNDMLSFRTDSASSALTRCALGTAYRLYEC